MKDIELMNTILEAIKNPSKINRIISPYHFEIGSFKIEYIPVYPQFDILEIEYKIPNKNYSMPIKIKDINFFINLLKDNFHILNKEYNKRKPEFLKSKKEKINIKDVFKLANEPLISIEIELNRFKEN